VIPAPPFSGIDVGPFHLSMYGLLVAVGAYLALRMTVRRYGALGGDPDLAERAGLVAIGSGFLGARVAYIIPRLDAFLDQPHHLLMVWNGGLAFLGGVVVAVPVTWWYVRRQRGDVAAMVDAVAPALPLAHAIGRWGCYFNQELYGRPTDVPWALQIEPRHRVAGYEQFQTFHPTFLYESLWNLALFGVLLWVDRRRVDGQRWLRRGTLGFLYLAGYGVGRSWIEWLRIDVPDTYAGLTRNGWTALLMAVSGVLGAWWWERRRDDTEAPGAGSTDRVGALEPSPVSAAEGGS
jgi:prolipoprotein diacylglyceryl transferase